MATTKFREPEMCQSSHLGGAGTLDHGKKSTKMMLTNLHPDVFQQAPRCVCVKLDTFTQVGVLI